MTRLERLRVENGWSKSKLGRKADINTTTIIWAEQRGFRLYPQQLAKLAMALDWKGDPEQLLEEVA